MAARDRDQDRKLVDVFGARVRQLRHDAGLTQEQLAEAAGLHPTYISNLERGYRVPTLTTILKVANGLDVEPGQLVNDLRP